MRTATVADAIVFSSRIELRKLAGEQLKMKGVSNVMTPETVDEFIDELGRFTKALVLVDWELGEATACRALAANRGSAAAANRMIMLIAGSVSEKLVATAAEYTVTQIFTEQLTSKTLGGRMANLMLEGSAPNDVKKGLLEAATARAGGDLKGALAALQKVLQKNPTNLRAKAEIGETLIAMGEFEAARLVLEGMEQVKPPYLRGLHLYGRALMKLGKFNEAIKVLEHANLFNGHDIDRLVDLGDAFLAVDRTAEARKAYDRALAIDGKKREAKMGKGQVALLDGHVNEGLSLLREVSGDVEIASLFNTTAVMSMRRGRHERGMGLYHAAVKALGRDEKIQARLYFNMGIGYRRWGKPDKAQGCFEESLRLDPSYDKARSQIQQIKDAAAANAQAHIKAASGDGMVKPAEPLKDLGGLIDFDASEPLFSEDEELEESLFE